MASLIIASGPDEDDYYPLDGKTVVVGRDAKCPIQLVDERVSRVHLQIRCEDGERRKWYAEDLKSANGVTMNTVPITIETPLANGDVLGVGDTKLVFFTRDFPNRKDAWDYYKIAGERSKPTMM